MKTRNGLVSNSSSSSFLCILPVSLHDQILKEMKAEGTITDIGIKLINGMVTRVRKFGMDMVTTSSHQDNGGNCWPDVSDETYRILSDEEREALEDSCDDIPTLYYNYQESVTAMSKKNPDQVYVDDWSDD